MTDAAIRIAETDVLEALTMDRAIEVLEDAFVAGATGRAASMPRAHLRFGAETLHAVGGALVDGGIAGTKTWLYTPGGAKPLVVLFSLEDGSLIALVEAFALGQLRTAAASGLATRLLARADARRLALVGTGRQALAQAQAVHAVRSLEHVSLFGRDAERRRKLAATIHEELAVTVTEHSAIEEAIAGADVVTTVTRAATPILGAGQIEPGVHVNAVGAFTPDRRELDADAIGCFDLVVVDSLRQARPDAAELEAAVERGLLRWEEVRELGAILAAGPIARDHHKRTLFKSLGLGLSDVALAHEVVRTLNTGAIKVSADDPLSVPS